MDPKRKIYHHPIDKLALGGILIPSDFKSTSRDTSQHKAPSNSASGSDATAVPLEGGMGLSGMWSPGTSLPGRAFIKTVLMENLLYLAIVNLLSKEDFEQAQEN